MVGAKRCDSNCRRRQKSVLGPAFLRASHLPASPSFCLCPLAPPSEERRVKMVWPGVLHLLRFAELLVQLLIFDGSGLSVGPEYAWHIPHL